MPKQKSTTVIASFEVAGFHQYNDAPESVSFLKNKHRHTFKISVGYKVSSLDREREIFTCTDEVKDYLHEAFGYPCQFENMSCEQIATEILEFGEDDGMVFCEVFEETTGGARVELN